MLQQKINALKKKLENEYHQKEKTLKEEMDKKAQEYETTIKAANTSEQQKMAAQYEKYFFNLIT